jgi:hypothetical protein
MAIRDRRSEISSAALPAGPDRDRSRIMLTSVPAAGIVAGLALAIPSPRWALVAVAMVLGWTQLAGP